MRALQSLLVLVGDACEALGHVVVLPPDEEEAEMKLGQILAQRAEEDLRQETQKVH